MTRSIPGLALAALVPVVAACGGSESGGEEARPRTGAAERPAGAQRSAGGCEPAVVKRSVDVARPRAGRDEPLAGELAGQDVRVEVLGVAERRSVVVRFGRRRRFAAPRGASLLGVTYRLRNRGDEALKPGAVLNRPALLRAGDALLRPAETAGCDVPLSASWAVGEGHDSPHALVAPGRARTTSVVFVLPRRAEAVSLHVPESNLDFDLEGA